MSKKIVQLNEEIIKGQIAKNERANIKKRQEQGIVAAKARGVRFDRPEKPIPEDFSEIVRKWEYIELDRAAVSRLKGTPAWPWKKAIIKQTF